MCGLVGIFSSKGRAADPASAAALERLVHRGPDGAGQWTSPSGAAWLGHRRLSIVDLSDRGLQPLANEDASIQVVCNGEIYNYPRLRADLERAGHRFASDSDSEVLVHAYEQWGDACVERLEGMFAFLLWDEPRRRLLAARDRVGIKPIFYAEHDGRLVLASEASALIDLLSTRPEPDPRAFAYVLTLGYIPAPHSMWRGVRKLEAGHFLTWEKSTAAAKIRPYWSPPAELADPDDPAIADEAFPELFESVLTDHLLADVPLGLFLSGGLDSTSIAVGLREIHQPLHAFTVSFPTSAEDEGPIAAKTARHLGFPHTDIPLATGDVGSLLTRVAAAYDEPQGYSALLSMYLICEKVAPDFKAVMAGDGGDEVFGGYTWYQDLDPPRRSLLQRARSRLNRLAAANGRVPAPAAVHRFTSRSVLHAHAWRLFPRFLPHEVQSLLAPTGLRFHEDDMIEPLERHFVRTLPLKRALQRVDLMTFCTDSILAKVDRASMAHSLEVRVPFLDHRLVEFGLSRPIDPREAAEPKPLLRDYLRERVPPDLLDRPKQGFSLRVIGNDLSWALDAIRRSWWAEQGFLDPRWENLVGPANPATAGRIWTLAVLSRWADAWIRNEPAPRAPASTPSASD